MACSKCGKKKVVTSSKNVGAQKTTTLTKSNEVTINGVKYVKK